MDAKQVDLQWFAGDKWHFMRFSLISFCIVVLGSHRCLSQSDDNLQPGIMKDVQLSVTVTTNVFKAGSSSVCESKLLNLSTNTIEMDPTSPNAQPSQLSIFLTDDAGKKYRLTPKHSVFFGYHPMVEVNPGQNMIETNVMTFFPVIKPGEYTLNAVRLFMFDGMPYITACSPAKVRIIQ